MKKLLAIIMVSLLLASALMFVGCNGSSDGYKEVGWDKIQEFIDKRASQPYDEDAPFKWKDGYSKIYCIDGEPSLVTKTYNKDGVSQIFIEDIYEDDSGELISSTKKYYVDGYLYEETIEEEYGEYQTTKTKEAMDYDSAIWRVNLDSDVFLIEDDLDMYRPYVIIGEDIKFYIAETDTGTKIRVEHRQTRWGTAYTDIMEYIYDSEYRMVEYYYKAVDNKNVVELSTEIRATTEPLSFPELTGYELVTP